jgi:hypothetical protein
MITLAQYVGPHKDSPDWNLVRQGNAKRLLEACAALEAEMVAEGIKFPDNPKTGSGVSGETFGGFRPQACPIGAPRSSHKDGLAVDRYDPAGQIDAWCMENIDRLEAHGICIEHPSKTPHWSHWTIKRPGSGKTVFYP